MAVALILAADMQQNAVCWWRGSRTTHIGGPRCKLPL